MRLLNVDDLDQLYRLLNEQESADFKAQHSRNYEVEQEPSPEEVAVRRQRDSE
jgi:hypothetical protein